MHAAFFMKYVVRVTLVFSLMQITGPGRKNPHRGL